MSKGPTRPREFRSARRWPLPSPLRRNPLSDYVNIACAEPASPRPRGRGIPQRSERIMSQTVSELLVSVLEQIGVKCVFGLIGDSLNPLADAIRRSQIEWIGVRHEEGAALAAAGQAKLTGRLGVCAGTTGPGSNHLVAGLYEASRDHAPVLALSGDMPRKMRGIDYIQTTEPDLLFRDVSLYTETISTAAQAQVVIHQAIAAAYAGPCVAHLTLPQYVLSAKAEGPV